MKNNRFPGTVKTNLLSLPVYMSILNLVTSLLFSCSSPEPKEEGIREVQISAAFDKNEEVGVSEITDGEIEYILLESKKECLLGGSAQVFATSGYILTIAKNQIYLFDRKTGKFIREIGHYGNDPGGYKRVIQAFPFDEERLLVYANGWDPKSYFRYSLTGEFVDKVQAYSIDKEDDLINNDFGEIITSIAPLNDTCFVGYVWNINGKQETKLIVFNENNHRIKSFPQYKHFDFDINRDGISVFQWNAKYYQLDNQLHFFERFTDTVFTVTPEKFEPRFILHKGETENATATEYAKSSGQVAYLLMENIFETKRFLFFKVGKTVEEFKRNFHYGFFDKVTGETKVSNNVSGLENDVDNFLPFIFLSANQNNEIISSVDAYKVKLWFDENPDKAKKISPELQKLKNIKETDNPVVIIAKLKE